MTMIIMMMMLMIHDNDSNMDDDDKEDVDDLCGKLSNQAPSVKVRHSSSRLQF